MSSTIGDKKLPNMTGARWCDEGAYRGMSSEGLTATAIAAETMRASKRSAKDGAGLWLKRRRGVHCSSEERETAINDFIEHYTPDPKPFIWHKNADQILDSVTRFCR